jgi:neurofibromin 1
MEAVASLLHSLPLQPEESDRGDLMEAKSQLFLKYFTLFMNLLNDCGDDLNDDQNSLSDHHQTNNERITSNITNQTQQQQQQQSQLINQLQQKQQSLRNSTIVAMSNLLAANIESGLMRSIGKSTIFFSFFYVTNNFFSFGLSSRSTNSSSFYGSFNTNSSTRN